MGANWSKLHRERVNASNRELIKAARSLVLAKYDHKCSRCGFSDERALQVDHVVGDGAEEKKSRHSIGEAAYYKKVFDDVVGKYQLLCANCNWIKRVENEEK